VNVRRKSVTGPGGVLWPVTVPCGHCLGCRTDQARGWAVRLVHEGMITSPAWFVTLTYAPEKLPEFGSLVPRDITLFVRRLREGSTRSLSYYVAGEYGETTARPHYHAVLFGPQFLDRERLADRHGAPVFRSDSLESAWGHGLCEFTGLTYAAARYVASYVRKKVSARHDSEHYTRVDPETGELVELQREYARMSRRPAIGKRWIERYWRDVYPRDFVVMDGRELKPPRYYDKWMDEHQPAVMMAVREQRYEDIVEIGDEKLIMKEKVHRARVALFQGRSGI
jgi:hypothetical protein